jgi:DNA-binding winged helix-turn-helix (wHTH) protein
MSLPTQGARRVRFGDFQLDLRTGELSDGGRKTRLQDKPFQVLSALIERPGEAVTREELRRRLWPDDTFVGFDHSLNNAVNRLRETLHDSAESSRYIETLPKLGYRFIAAVEAEEDRESVAEIPEKPRSESVRRLGLAVALAAAIFALALTGYWAGFRLSPRTQPANTTAVAAPPEPVGVPPGRVAYVFPETESVSFRFTGSSADYMRIPNHPLLEPEHVSVNAWVRAAKSPGIYRYIVAKGAEGCRESSYALYTGTNGGLVFYVAGLPKHLALVSAPASPGIWNGQWHHVAGTFDGLVVRLYVDGAEVGFGVHGPKGSKIRYGLSTNNDLLIGGYVGTCTAPFRGEIGEVEVFNRALSQTEIASLFRARKVRYETGNPAPPHEQRTARSCIPPPPSLVGLWTAEEDLREDIGQLQPFVVGAVNRGAGKAGSGMQLLGGGHLEYRDAPQFDLGGALTVEGWVYYSGFAISPRDGGVLFAKWGDAKSPSASYGLFVRSNGVPYFALSSDGVSATRAEASLPLVVDLTHLAGVWDGAMMRLYVNGVLVATASFSGPLKRGRGPLYIGGRTNPATGEDESVAGIFDDFGLYNRALTEKEIVDIYRAGSAGKCR